MLLPAAALAVTAVTIVIAFAQKCFASAESFYSGLMVDFFIYLNIHGFLHDLSRCFFVLPY